MYRRLRLGDSSPPAPSVGRSKVVLAGDAGETRSSVDSTRFPSFLPSRELGVPEQHGSAVESVSASTHPRRPHSCALAG